MPSSHPCVCTTLRKAARAVTRVYDDDLSAFGMTITQFAVLRNLARHGTVALSRLADLLVMERTTLYRLLTPVERLGWIRVESGTGRAKFAVLTDNGRAALLAATPAWEATQADLIGKMGAENWNALQTSLGLLGGLTKQEAR